LQKEKLCYHLKDEGGGKRIPVGRHSKIKLIVMNQYWSVALNRLVQGKIREMGLGQHASLIEVTLMTSGHSVSVLCCLPQLPSSFGDLPCPHHITWTR
jgi:hypothetical protein